MTSSPPPQRGSSLGERLWSIGWLALLLLGAPLLVLLDLRARWRVRAIGRGLAFTFATRLGIDAGTLTARHHHGAPPTEIPIERIAEVEVWHVTGDGGFADGNSQTYLLVLTLADGTRVGLSHVDVHPYDFATKGLESLRAAGVLHTPVRVVNGPVQGLGGCLVYGSVVIWLLALATVLVRSAR